MRPIASRITDQILIPCHCWTTLGYFGSQITYGHWRGSELYLFARTDGVLPLMEIYNAAHPHAKAATGIGRPPTV